MKLNLEVKPQLSFAYTNNDNLPEDVKTVIERKDGRGEALARLIEKSGKTCAEISRNTGISQALMSYYVTDKKKPPVENLKEILKEIGIKVDGRVIFVSRKGMPNGPRAVARRQGAKYYQLAKPCKRGHLGMAHTSYGCLPCVKARVMEGSVKDNVKKRRAALRQIAADAKNRPCYDCGIQFPSVCMDFDHRDRKTKTDLVSKMVFHGAKPEKLKLELEKCDVVCANCHRIRTAKQFKWNPEGIMPPKESQ